jgi:catechol-2,3-dioxygenase
MPPILQSIDHIHVYVSDRARAEAWYSEAFGLVRLKEFEFWADDGGPLTIANAQGSIHLALFEKPLQACRSTIAMKVTAHDFLAWQAHLSGMLTQQLKAVDHEVSWSLYLSDPDGNPYEITTYEYDELAARIG